MFRSLYIAVLIFAFSVGFLTNAPNVNAGPQMGPPGFTPAAPYYDPSLPSTMSVYSPADVAFQQDLAGIGQGIGQGVDTGAI